MTEPNEVPPEVLDEMPDPVTALTDPNNVRFVPLEEWEAENRGFSDEEVEALMNAPAEVIASSGNGES